MYLALYLKCTSPHKSFCFDEKVPKNRCFLTLFLVFLALISAFSVLFSQFVAYGRRKARYMPHFPPHFRLKVGYKRGEKTGYINLTLVTFNIVMINIYQHRSTSFPFLISNIHHLSVDTLWHSGISLAKTTKTLGVLNLNCLLSYLVEIEYPSLISSNKV